MPKPFPARPDDEDLQQPADASRTDDNGDAGNYSGVVLVSLGGNNLQIAS